MRKKAGEKALCRFFRRQESCGQIPAHLEKSFKWQEDRVRFIGRWDRVDCTKRGAVIVDFKASEVKSQKEADKRARESLQMDLYALSYLRTQGELPSEMQLYFLESDIVGCSSKGEEELARAEEKIRETEAGIRSRNFEAKPDWHNCNYCDFKTICPSSYAY